MSDDVTRLSLNTVTMVCLFILVHKWPGKYFSTLPDTFRDTLPMKADDVSCNSTPRLMTWYGFSACSHRFMNGLKIKVQFGTQTSLRNKRSVSKSPNSSRRADMRAALTKDPTNKDPIWQQACTDSHSYDTQSRYFAHEIDRNHLWSEHDHLIGGRFQEVCLPAGLQTEVPIRVVCMSGYNILLSMSLKHKVVWKGKDEHHASHRRMESPRSTRGECRLSSTAFSATATYY